MQAQMGAYRVEVAFASNSRPLCEQRQSTNSSSTQAPHAEEPCEARCLEAPHCAGTPNVRSRPWSCFETQTEGGPLLGMRAVGPEGASAVAPPAAAAAVLARLDDLRRGERHHLGEL